MFRGSEESLESSARQDSQDRWDPRVPLELLGAEVRVEIAVRVATQA